MQKSIIWFYLFLKSQIRQWETWVICACMVATLLLAGLVRNPEKNNLEAAVYVRQNDKISMDMQSMLLKADSLFTFYEENSEEELKADVQNGNCICGFIIENDFAKKVKNGEQKGCITYICNQETVRGRVARETVYARFYELFSEYIVRKYVPEVAGGDSVIINKAVDQERSYLNGSSLFQVQYVSMDTEVKQKDNKASKRVYPVEGLFISFMLIGVLLVNTQNRTKNRKDILSVMTPADGIRFRLCQYLAQAGIIAMIGEICLLITGRGAGIREQCICLPFSVLLCMVWALITDKIFTKEITYHVWMVTILFFHVLISPVFFRPDTYIPAIKYIQWVSPVGFFLKMMEIM